MNVIGFGGSGHDWASCLINANGQLVNIEEERLNRKKFGVDGNLLMSLSREKVVGAMGLRPQEIDLAVACDLVPLPLIFPYRKKIHRLRHHEAHGYSAFFASPFDQAAILIADHSGSPLDSKPTDRQASRMVETTTIWKTNGQDLQLLSEISGKQELAVNSPVDFYTASGLTNNSLGQLYQLCSESLGFSHILQNGGQIAEDGKTMGLAAYGDQRFYPELREYLHLESEGHFTINFTNGEFQQNMQQLLAGLDFTQPAAFSTFAAVANAIQCMLEDALLHVAHHAKKLTGLSKLCMSGGVALNCVANAKIAEQCGFDDLFIVPAAGDSGIALGAALYGRIKLAGLPPLTNLYDRLPFLGPKYSTTDHTAAMSKYEGYLGEIGQTEDLYTRVAELIANGAIVGWFEGQSEMGPRALGHRSIFADPRKFETRERINRKIKNRETFRPFAGCFLAESLTEYINIKELAALPFMLMVGKIKRTKLDKLQAIAHTDGTTRIQLVKKNRYPSLYRLIQSFKAKTGVSCVLNTSFNLSGEPLVESPEDAISCFLRSGLDYLVLQGKIYGKQVQRNTARHSPDGQLENIR